MSLVKPHPIWTTCGSNPFEVNKAMIQARMLSGRYITDQLARHWTQNAAGVCLLPGCPNNVSGTIEDLLLHCPALQPTRQKMVNLCHDIARKYTHVQNLIHAVPSGTKQNLLIRSYWTVQLYPHLSFCSKLMYRRSLSRCSTHLRHGFILSIEKEWTCWAFSNSNEDISHFYELDMFLYNVSIDLKSAVNHEWL